MLSTRVGGTAPATRAEGKRFVWRRSMRAEATSVEAAPAPAPAPASVELMRPVEPNYD